MSLTIGWRGRPIEREAASPSEPVGWGALGRWEDEVQLLGEARELLDDAIALRRQIHRRPEIGLQLPETQAAVVEALQGADARVHLGERCSSVAAVLDGAHPGPTVLLRGDMDALPMSEATGL